jgi:hypothetical protein
MSKKQRSDFIMAIWKEPEPRPSFEGSPSTFGDTDQRAVLVTSSSHAIKKSRSCRKNAVLTSVSEVYDRRKAQRLSLMLVP